MIGNVLRNIRKIRGLTQANVGRDLHLAIDIRIDYETEYSNPNFDTIYKFAKVCDFDIIFVDKRTKKEYDVKALSKEMDF